MKRFESIFMAAIATLIMTGDADAADRNRTEGQNPKSSFMRVFGQALPPIGHVGFCRRHPEECRATETTGKRIALTAERLHQLKSVNAIVNQMVRPETDLKLYGRLEHWTYPSEYGDCEDYVILKRRLLIERGWPASALLITVVRDENDEGHAILTARTAAGDYLLDNKHSDIMRWEQSAYLFVKRQSYTNPKLWMSLASGKVRQQQRFSSTRSR